MLLRVYPSQLIWDKLRLWWSPVGLPTPWPVISLLMLLKHPVRGTSTNSKMQERRFWPPVTWTNNLIITKMRLLEVWRVNTIINTRRSLLMWWATPSLGINNWPDYRRSMTRRAERATKLPKCQDSQRLVALKAWRSITDTRVVSLKT